MCLAVPMKIESIEGDTAMASASGVTRRVSLMLLGDVKVGEHVLVHAGFAIQRVDAKAADETLAALAALSIPSPL